MSRRYNMFVVIVSLTVQGENLKQLYLYLAH